MTSQTVESRLAPRYSTQLWADGIVSGLIAGIGMGLIMHYIMNAMPLIGALYGQPSVMAGWIAHLFHSIVFGLIFAAVITQPRFDKYGILGIVGLGAVYGLILEFVAAGVVLPLWANTIGAAMLPVPFLIPIGFVTHLVYGILLGAAMGVLLKRTRAAVEVPDPSTA